MKENHSNKKKLLSEDELLEVTGGNGEFYITITCKNKKNQEACEEFGCEWNKETEKCIGDKEITY